MCQLVPGFHTGALPILALQEMQVSLSAILAEANSADPWTSRARPTFLYVIYGVILLSVIGSIIGIWWPAEVFQADDNLSKLLNAVPESLWWLFGAGYLSYTGARSFAKWPGRPRLATPGAASNATAVKPSPEARRVGKKGDRQCTAGG